MADIQIVIPSRGRAGTVPALRLFPSAVLAVRPEEEDAYRAAHPDAAIVVTPATKTLAEKRQWLWERFGDVFMSDDDVDSVTDLSCPPGTPNRVPDDQAEAIVQSSYQTTKQIGAYLFGYNPYINPIGYTEHRPFNLTGTLSMHAIGLLHSPHLYLRPDISLYDDAWIGLLNTYHHRLMFEDLRYHFRHPGTMVTPGGLSNLRSEERLLYEVAQLRAAFGDAIEEQQSTATRDVFSRGQIRIHVPL